MRGRDVRWSLLHAGQGEEEVLRRVPGGDQVGKGSRHGAGAGAGVGWLAEVVQGDAGLADGVDGLVEGWYGGRGEEVFQCCA